MKTDRITSTVDGAREFERHNGQRETIDYSQEDIDDCSCETCVHRDVFALDPPCWGCENKINYEPINQ
jgi:hypothetical protein